MIKPLRQMAKSYSIGTKKGEYMKIKNTIVRIEGGCLLELINNSTLIESGVADI